MDAFMVNVDDISMSVQAVTYCAEQVREITVETSNQIGLGLPSSVVLKDIQQVCEGWAKWQADATQLIADFANDMKNSIELYMQTDSTCATEFHRIRKPEVAML